MLALMANGYIATQVFFSSMTKRRYQLAAVIAPAAPTLVLIGFALANGDSYSPWLVLIVAFALIVGYAGFFAVGVPLIHFLRRMGWLSLPTLVFSGAAAGIAVLGGVGKLLGILLGSSGSFDLSYVLSYVSWGAGLGFAVALLFSLIAGIPIGRVNQNNSRNPPND